MSSARVLPVAVSALAPGVVACALVAVAAYAGAQLEHRLFGRAWLEALVLAILLGAIVRLVWSPSEAHRKGIAFCAKQALEVAIVLLGASVSATTLSSLGLGAVAAIVALVVVGIAVSTWIGRLLGLSPRLALLAACGNGICGNSAIVSVAPVLNADGEEVVSAIAFTAALGVAVVLLLPALGGLLGLSPLAYGFLAGLTVYAVPQVLAAAAPFGPLAVQTGTLVKLVRVLMLGPVVIVLSLIGPRGAQQTAAPLTRLVPWFILGFLALMGLRLLHLIPEALLPALAQVSSILTLLAMAALGLQTQLAAVARSGGRMLLAAFLSLLALIGLSLILVRVVL